MRYAIDLVGKKFGRLTVIAKSSLTKNGRTLWECSCECGNKTNVVGYSLNNGSTQSCGCLRNDLRALSRKPRVCKRCGGTEFYVGRNCKNCHKVVTKKWRTENQERVKEKIKEWRMKNKERMSFLTKEWYLLNKERKLKNEKIRRDADKERERLRGKRYRDQNPEKNKATKSGWKKRNRGKVTADTVRRMSMELKATPSWANDFFIEEIYILSQLRTELTGIKHHVDHIVPLRSKVVCGLHVHNNLRVIPAEDNMKKGNRHVYTS